MEFINGALPTLYGPWAEQIGHWLSATLPPLHNNGIGDFVFFKLISDYLGHAVATLTGGLMTRAMEVVGLLAPSLMFAWLMIVGYQVATGRYRGSATALMTDLTKKTVIVLMAATMSFFGTDLSRLITVNMDQAINTLVTGESGTGTVEAVDQNLAYTQVATAVIDAVVVMEDAELQREKANALLLASFGTSSPALAAGAMQLFFQFVLGWFIGLGPVFILAALFPATQRLFRRWLQYGIATLFAMAGLSAVTAIVLEFCLKVAAGYWGAKAINGISGAEPEGLSLLAHQQGWLGLIMSRS